MNIQFSKFLRSDYQLRSKAIILAACFFILLIQLKIFGVQTKQVSQARAEKAVVQRIPDLEKSVREHTIVTADQGAIVVKAELNLQGTMIQEGVPVALIDGLVYAQGDSIGNYTVAEILMGKVGKVVLVNKETQESKELFVHNDE